jgi:hypothetical protein
MVTEGTARLAHRAPAPEEIVGLLADPVRRRVVAALDGASRSGEEVAAEIRADARTVFEHLTRLVAAEVVIARDDGRYALVDDVFARSVRDAASERIGALNDQHTQLARRYFYRNRLVQMPSEPWAVTVVLELIAEDFQPGEIYSEREVSTTLYAWYGDYALLRRMLVDQGYLMRDHGEYWRAG